MNLEGKVAVITGASRGLGVGIAEAAREAGMSLVVCSRNRPALEPSSTVHALEADVSKAEDVDRLAREAVERFGHVDLWVNNAGLLDPVGPLRETEPGDLATHFEVNVLGVALGSRAFLRLLHEGDRTGVLLNIASGAGRRVYEGWAAYCAGKAAVDHLSEVIAAEEHERVRVYAVAPGVLDTPMQAQVRSHDASWFPQKPKFMDAHATGSLVPPRQAGERLLALAFDPAFELQGVCVDLRDLPGVAA